MNQQKEDPSQGDAAVLGLVLLAMAAGCGQMAQLHFQRLGEICGAAAPHCGWCAAAAALALSALGAFAAAIRPRAAARAQT